MMCSVQLQEIKSYFVQNSWQIFHQEYIRGISAWNFNLEDLKNQAALIPDDDTSNAEDSSVCGKERDGHDDVGSPTGRSSPQRTDTSEDGPHAVDGLNNLHDLENSLAAFPIKPLQALKGCFDLCEDDDIAPGSPSWNDGVPFDPEQQSQIKSSTKAEGQKTGRDDNDNLGRSSCMPHSVIRGQNKLISGSLLPDNVISPKKSIGVGDREYFQPRYPADRNYSGPLQLRQKKEINHPVSGEDSSDGATVQRKGRFKVTSADLSPKGPTNFLFSLGGSSNSCSSSLSAFSVLPSLQCILHQNTMQREEILKLIKYVEQSSGNLTEFADGGNNNVSQITGNVDTQYYTF